MKELHIDLNSGVFSTGVRQSYTLNSDQRADAAYAKIKAAMAQYREHGNDREATVEIELDADDKATIKTSAILSAVVIAVGNAESVEMSVARYRHEKTIKDRLKAEGLWEEKNGKT